MHIDPVIATLGIVLFLGGFLAMAAIFVPGWAKSADKLVKENLKDVEYDRLQKIAGSVCRFVEQRAKSFDWSSEEKQAEAAKWIEKVAGKFGLEVDDELLDILIEEAVQVINTEVLPALGLEEYVSTEGLQ